MHTFLGCILLGALLVFPGFVPSGNLQILICQYPIQNAVDFDIQDFYKHLAKID